MKRYPRIILGLAIVIGTITYSHAQTATDPVAYMNKFTESERQINSQMLSYVSAIAHDKSPKKVDKQRIELISIISAARSKAAHSPDFEGDSNLRVSCYNYFNIAYIVAKEDYGKIVDMEEIADQSYDNMEAYLKAQEVANDKEHEAFEKVDREIRAFAATHHITLTEDNSKESKQSEIVNEVTKYYNKVYLAFYKCNSNEKYLIKAIDKKDINGIEQNKNALLKNSIENLPKLDKIGQYQGDGSLIASSEKLLQFYKEEAKEKTPVLTAFLVKNDNFQKMKKDMDAKTNHTQEEVNKFNAAVKDINDAVVLYNKTNNELNQTRTRLINDMNGSMEAFMNKHIPRHK
jgi:hypothetical protein